MKEQPQAPRGRVIAQEWLSLDGFAAGPGGEADLFAAVDPEADAASQRWNRGLLAKHGTSTNWICSSLLWHPAADAGSLLNRRRRCGW